MKDTAKLLLAAFIGALLLPCGCASRKHTVTPPAPDVQPPAAALTNRQDKASYAIGMDLGARLKRANIEVNLDALRNGLEDALAGRELKLTERQARETIMVYQQQRQHELAEKNLTQGEVFLAENKKKEGVKTQPVALPGGETAELQYRVIAEGAGETPGSNDVVTVNYRGTLINGTEFDSSAKHGKAAIFPVKNVIRGWSEALQMMKAGSKWELYIPASLGYGDRPMPGIEPGSTLIFEVELLSFAPPATTASARPPMTSDIIRVPSAEEMKAGAKIEVIKPQDMEKNATGQTNGIKTD